MFVKTLIVTKPVLSEDGAKALGQITLVNEVFSRRMLNSEEGTVEKEVLRECKTEEERTEGLEEWFGIVLRDDEKKGIRGLVSEIRPKPKTDG